MILVVGVTLVDASVTLGCRVDLHLRLDTVLPAPELSDLFRLCVRNFVYTLKQWNQMELLVQNEGFTYMQIAMTI